MGWLRKQLQRVIGSSLDDQKNSPQAAPGPEFSPKRCTCYDHDCASLLVFAPQVRGADLDQLGRPWSDRLGIKLSVSYTAGEIVVVAKDTVRTIKTCSACPLHFLPEQYLILFSQEKQWCRWPSEDRTLTASEVNLIHHLSVDTMSEVLGRRSRILWREVKRSELTAF